MKTVNHQIKVNTPWLLEECLNAGQGASALVIPLRSFQAILAQVATRAAEINDPQLNALMMRLALYSVSEPGSPDYDPEFVSNYLDANQ